MWSSIMLAVKSDQNGGGQSWAILPVKGLLMPHSEILQSNAVRGKMR